MSEPGPPKQDPRFRPYRALMWALYIGFASFIGIATTVSVLDSVRFMTPRRPPRNSPPLDIEACRALASQLFSELDTQRKNMSHAEEVRRVDADWTRWRVKWMNEFRDAEARCDVDSPDREKTRELFSALEKVADLYTTHAVQFAGEVGPALDALNAALKQKVETAQSAVPEPGRTTP